MARLIKAIGGEKQISPKNGKKFELKEAQRLVRGYIQIIPLDEENVMVMDEEGKLKHNIANAKATRIAEVIAPTSQISISKSNPIHELLISLTSMFLECLNTIHTFTEICEITKELWKLSSKIGLSPKKAFDECSILINQTKSLFD